MKEAYILFVEDNEVDIILTREVLKEANNDRLKMIPVIMLTTSWLKKIF